MKKVVLLVVIVAACSATSLSQVSEAKINAGIKKFPGISRAYMEQLIAAKAIMSIVLPTWLPSGFSVERIQSRIGRRVSLDDREFVIIYSRKVQDGKLQRFALEAGFEGLGGLPYDPTKVIASPIGTIDLMYEPADPDGGGKIENYSMTEWFNPGKIPFHYDGMYGALEGDSTQTMLTLEDTEKILGSLKRL